MKMIHNCIPVVLSTNPCKCGYYPDRILKSGNRTIVFWNDGEKTIVKRADGEPDNTYVAFTAALKSANITVQIGNREFGRILREAGAL